MTDALREVTRERVLPPHVFDALQLSAVMYGGIGAGNFSASGQPDVPLCILGHAGVRVYVNCIGKEVSAACERSGLDIYVSDNAVAAINRRKGVRVPLGPWLEPRVSWEEYCAELNIVRGHETPSLPIPAKQSLEVPVFSGRTEEGGQ